MKCESCGEEIEETILNKIVGTVVKDSQGKEHYFCNNCQKKGEDELVE